MKRIQIPDCYSTKVVRNIEGIKEIYGLWKELQWHPNSEIDHYLNILNVRSDIIRPHVILIYKDGNLVSMLVGRIVTARFQCKIGYKSIYQPLVKTLSLIYGGMQGEDSYEICVTMLSEIQNALRQREADIVHLNSLNVESNLYQVIKNSTNWFSKEKGLVPVVHRMMSLPDDFDEFLQAKSQKHRYWLRRINRILEKDYPESIKIKSFLQRDEVDMLCGDAEEIAQKTYQRGLGVGFIDSSEIRSILYLAAEKGFLRGYILYVEEKPCAFCIGRCYGDTFYFDYTAYDSEFKKYEVGTIIFIKMIERLCLEKNIKYFDFGFGDSLYKQRYGDKSWEEFSFYLFPGTLKGIKLIIIKSLSSLVSNYSKAILTHYKILDKVKRNWRNIIRPK